MLEALTALFALTPNLVPLRLLDLAAELRGGAVHWFETIEANRPGWGPMCPFPSPAGAHADDPVMFLWLAVHALAHRRDADDFLLTRALEVAEELEARRSDPAVAFVIDAVILLQAGRTGMAARERARCVLGMQLSEAHLAALAAPVVEVAPAPAPEAA